MSRSQELDTVGQKLRNMCRPECLQTRRCHTRRPCVPFVLLGSLSCPPSPPTLSPHYTLSPHTRRESPGLTPSETNPLKKNSLPVCSSQVDRILEGSTVSRRQCLAQSPKTKARSVHSLSEFVGGIKQWTRHMPLPCWNLIHTECK